MRENLHVFSQSLRVGKEGEATVFHGLTKVKGWLCCETTSREAQGLGIDGVITIGDGTRFSAEVKTCNWVHKTGNMAFDEYIIGADGKKSAGWPYTCTAQLLIYLARHSGACWIMNMLNLKKKMAEYRRTYGLTEIKSRKEEREFSGMTILVPVVVVERDCGAKKINLKGE